MIVSGDEALDWASQRFGVPRTYFGTIAGAVGNCLDERLRAVVVYNRTTPQAVYGHIISDGTRRWATPGYMHAIFHYPFVVLGKRRFTVLVDETNDRSNRMVKKMGFSLESVQPYAGLKGGDMYVYRMLREECRWI